MADHHQLFVSNSLNKSRRRFRNTPTPTPKSAPVELKLQHQYDQQKSLQWPPVTGIVFCLWRGGPRFYRVTWRKCPRTDKRQLLLLSIQTESGCNS